MILALLVSNTARSLACRLAGGLALAASAVCNSLCNILGFDSLNSIHNYLRLLIEQKYFTDSIITQYKNIVNRFTSIFSLF